MINRKSLTLFGLLDKVNPLALRNLEGVGLAIFPKHADCYFEAMKRMWHFAPCGFIDIVLFMVKEQGEFLDIRDIYTMCTPHEYAFVPTWENCPERNQILYTILSMMGQPCNTLIDKEQFALSLFYLDAFFEKEALNIPAKLTANVKLI